VEEIGPALEKVVAGTVRRSLGGPVLAWPLACGSAVAERTQAVGFQAGVLRVEVPDAGWRNELIHLAPRYVSALNRYSASRVERIEFVIAKRSAQK